MTNRYYTFNQWVVAMMLGCIASLIAYLLKQLGLVSFDLVAAHRRFGSVEGQFHELVSVCRDIKGLYADCMEQKERVNDARVRIEEKCGVPSW